MNPVSAPETPERRLAPFAAGGRIRKVFGSAYVMLVLTMAMWGGNAAVGRVAVGEVSPMALVASRWIMVSAVLLIIARRRFVAEWPILRARWRFVLVMGAVGYTLTNAMYFGAAHLTSGINMAILPGGIPVFVLIGVVLFHRTRVRAVQVIGVLLTIAGIVIIASKGHLSVLRALRFNPGDLLIVANTILYAGFTIGLRDRPNVSGMTLFSGMAAAALLTTLPLVGYEMYAGTVQWPATWRGWLIVVYVGLLTSLIAQLMYLRAVELIGPSRSGLFVNLVPVFGAVFTVVFLDEPVGLYHVIALALVIGGILLAEAPMLRRLWRSPRPAPAEAGTT
jgi:drug/metabolite transporter (DMT)-like permease